MINQNADLAMPKEIAKASFDVMAAVQAIERDEENVHRRYAYATVDAFFEMIREKCVAAGLMIYPAELSCERIKIEDERGTRFVLHATYEFVLIHASGVTWRHPFDRRSVMSVWSGPQSNGAMQSYAVKQFMRAFWQIPTGERDADELDQADRATIEQKPAKNAARRAAGKTATSVLTSFDLGADKITLAMDEIADAVLPFIEEASEIELTGWRSRNQEALDYVHEHDKRLWLKITNALENKLKG